MFATSCRKCQWMRIYLCCALLAVVMIGARPEQAQALAGMMPSALIIGIMIMLGGSVAFYLRFQAYRAEQQAAMHLTPEGE